jgi:predicted dehydrogenase
MARNMKKIRLGVVGWGGRGGGVACEAIQATGGLMEPVACVDPSDEKYESGSERFGIRPARYESVRAMVESKTVDAVLIGSPNNCHLDNLREMEGFKLPVFLEKPLESTFEKICEVVRFARRYKGPILVGHCMRYAPIYQEVVKMLARGDVGKICSARFVQSCHYGNGAFHGWRRTRKEGGSQLLEKATHDLDCMMGMIRCLPETVYAVNRLQAFGGDRSNTLRCRDCDERVTCPESTQNIAFRNGNYKVEELRNPGDLCVYGREIDINDNESMLIEFQGGITGSYQQWFFSPRSYHHRVYEIYGTEGALELDFGAEFGGKITFCPRFGTLADKQEYNFDYLLRNHYNGDGAMTKHFWEVCTGRAEPMTTIEQAFMAEVLGYGALVSGDRRKIVQIGSLLPKDLRSIYASKVY